MTQYLLFSNPVVAESLSYVQLFATPWTAACRVPLSFTVSPSLLKFTSMNQWCYLTISSSVIPFFSCPQSLQASGSFPVSQLFASSGQSIGTSVSASILPMNIQGWFPLGLTSLISLLSKGLSKVFSSTTVQKHQFLAFHKDSHVVHGVAKSWTRLSDWT